MRISDTNEEVFRAKIFVDDLGEVSAASFDTMGKGCSIHLRLNRPINEVLELLIHSVANSSNLPVGKLTVGDVDSCGCELHQDNNPKKIFHGNITGLNQYRILSDVQKTLLALHCQLIFDHLQ